MFRVLQLSPNAIWPWPPQDCESVPVAVLSFQSRWASERAFRGGQLCGIIASLCHESALKSDGLAIGDIWLKLGM